ncbi:MAG: hypothetical protein A2521_08905 [Deltaproteobacteria bacterium RIFOXYD12_FULL_57_12]|nr:MAG: hypothetical protein A2521_08905 [Deltaproteobacteria bacterium RIFOXYD12_FULL_57_12]
MPAGSVLFQVKEDQGVELLFKFYLQWPVASRASGDALGSIEANGWQSRLNERAPRFSLVTVKKK